MSEAIFWPLLLGVLGAVFGSFIATCAIRWPAGRSALAGRSQCDGCGRTLAARDLVPLLSWAMLRGRCRACGEHIARSHPATEMLGLAIGMLAGFAAPGWEGAAGAVFGWLLLAAGAIDVAAFWLPDEVTSAISIAGLAGGMLSLGPPLLDRAIGGIAGIAALWLVATSYRRLRGRDGLGGGDAKLFGAIGLWLGWRALPPTLLIACLIGLAAVVALALAGRKLTRTDRLPFGAMLAVAAFAMWLWPRLGGYDTLPA